MNRKKAVKLTKNADSDRYGCSGYGIEFDACSVFSLSNDEWDKCFFFFVFGIDNSSSY